MTVSGRLRTSRRDLPGRSMKPARALNSEPATDEMITNGGSAGNERCRGRHGHSRPRATRRGRRGLRGGDRPGAPRTGRGALRAARGARPAGHDRENTNRSRPDRSTSRARPSPACGPPWKASSAAASTRKSSYRTRPETPRRALCDHGRKLAELRTQEAGVAGHLRAWPAATATQPSKPGNWRSSAAISVSVSLRGPG
jgi:hypothetical protein